LFDFKSILLRKNVRVLHNFHRVFHRRVLIIRAFSDFVALFRPNFLFFERLLILWRSCDKLFLELANKRFLRGAEKSAKDARDA